jgi:hypothetical protein
MMGARCAQDLDEQTGYLISRAPEGEKYNRACQWKIPVVTEEWLYRCAELGEEQVSPEEYRIDQRPVALHPVQLESQPSMPLKRPLQDLAANRKKNSMRPPSKLQRIGRLQIQVRQPLVAV